MLQCGSRLGGGIDAEVYSNDKNNYALKMFSKILSYQAYKNEIKIMRAIPEHENIMKMLNEADESSCLVKGAPPNTSCIVYDLMSGSLDELEMNIDEAKYATRKLFEALAHIHKHNIVHCDVKPDNMLWGPNNTIRLSDFGSSCFEGAPDTYNVGTVRYNSPEVSLTLEYGKSADIWAAFATAFLFATGCDLFHEGSGDEDYDYSRGNSECSTCTDDDFSDYDEYDSTYNTLRLIEDIVGPLPAHLRYRGRDYYNALGHLKYHPRATKSTNLLEVCMHNYNCNNDSDIRVAYELAEFLEWGLRTEPRERPTAEEVLAHPWLNDINMANIAFP
jgi:serine/threonine protein kinase